MPPITTRRDFFRSLRKQKQDVPFAPNSPSPNPPEDPLFKKYARKEAGRSNSNNATNSTNVRVNPITSGLGLYGGTFGDWQKKHLINRITFGFRKQDLDALNGLSVSQAVDLMIPTQASSSPFNPPINNYQTELPDTTGVAYGATWVNSALQYSVPGSDEVGYRRIYGSIRNWYIGSILNSENKITDKMTLFWFHFIPTQLYQLEQQSDLGFNAARFQYDYLKLIRSFCLGNFKTMIRQISTSPGMMNYLNNQNNTATEPNENYARELMELFTLGAGSGYTEDDVQNAARVLSGWRTEDIESINTATNFIPGDHSQGNKTFSAFFNNTVITGRGGADGRLELDDLINMIFSKSQVVAKYICKRLYRFFVYYDVDTTIENNIINNLAQTFINSNWEIRPVLLQLFKSEHFFDPQNLGVIIKSPIDLVIGYTRTLRMNVQAAPGDYKSQYEAYGSLMYDVENMQQDMLNVPTVSGWRPYYQPPTYHQGWITSDSIQRRYAFVDGRLWGFYYIIDWRVDFVQWVNQFTLPNDPNIPNNNNINGSGNPNVVVNQTIKFLLPLDLSQAKKDEIKRQTLLNGQTTDNYWTSLWSQYNANPSDMSLFEQVNNRVRSLLQAITKLAEYNLM
jgi:Protein of unknown function (DUF1800)